MRRQDGFAAPVLVVVVAVVLVSLAGVSADLWRLLAAHRMLTGHVDAAATAASGVIDEEAYRRDPDAAPVLDADGAVVAACEVLAGAELAGGCPGPSASIDVVGDRATVVARQELELLIVGRAFGNADSIEIVATSTAVAVRGEP